ncbi:hypothetical protein HYW42_00900 [Candidatus Daviesbacteria bacterium]|nr:hypothetical protein [Candidatus Daviesbacteria bacterium]
MHNTKLSPFQNKQINKNHTTLVRIDAELHRLLKIKAVAERTTIRTLIEGALADVLEVKSDKKQGVENND